MNLFAIQHFTGEKWVTIYVTSYEQDAVDTYMDIRGLTSVTIRSVKFTVESYDFIATHARDFAVLALREQKPEQPQTT